MARCLVASPKSSFGRTSNARWICAYARVQTSHSRGAPPPGRPGRGDPSALHHKVDVVHKACDNRVGVGALHTRHCRHGAQHVEDRAEGRCAAHLARGPFRVPPHVAHARDALRRYTIPIHGAGPRTGRRGSAPNPRRGSPARAGWGGRTRCGQRKRGKARPCRIAPRST